MARLDVNLLNEAVQAAYDAEYRAVFHNQVPVIRSRGRWVNTMGGEGSVIDQCSPCPGAEAQDFRGTRKQLENLVEDIEDRHPHVKELWVEGGFDGADSLRDMLEDLYDPWVGSWEVLVWTRENGWVKELCS